VPKKRKTVQDENSRSKANGSSLADNKIDKKHSRVRSTTTKRSEPAKKTATNAKAAKGSKPARVTEPSDEAIRTRAYFIAERRHRLELSGDANTDWIEARRQLVSETAPPR